MKVLIVGGGGDVGRIINKTIESIHEVTHLDLKPVPGAEDRTIVGSIADDAAVKEATAGQDAIVYAALGRIPGAPKHTCDWLDPAFDGNVRDQYRVLKAALDQGVRKFITLSTMGVYGNASVAQYILDEDNTPPAAFDNYGLSKHLAEQLYVAAAQQFPDGVFLVLRLNLPQNEESFNKQRSGYHPELGLKNFCALGPKDMQRLMIHALSCDTKGCHIVQTTGDIEGVHFPNTKATALLDWAPLNF